MGRGGGGVGGGGGGYHPRKASLEWIWQFWPACGSKINYGTHFPQDSQGLSTSFMHQHAYASILAFLGDGDKEECFETREHGDPFLLAAKNT